MKFTICFITILLLLFGCKKDSPTTHHFELVAAQKAEEVSEGIFLVGWIRASLGENNSKVQTLSVELDLPDDYWIKRELAKQDINFDGYTDIGVHERGGAKWGKIHFWLYDPEAKRFYHNSLTEEISKLTHANFWTDPKTRQIKISKFHGAEIKEYTYQLVEEHLHLVESKYIYQLVDKQLRLVGSRPSVHSIGRLLDGRDSCPVLYNQE